MRVVDGEVVGLCGFKSGPSADGEVELGYSVAASRRRQGHGSAAVGAVIEAAKDDPSVHAIIAVTSIYNIASQRVLERNGFERVGARINPEEGEEMVWRKPV